MISFGTRTDTIKLLVERHKAFYSVGLGNNWCSISANMDIGRVLIHDFFIVAIHNTKLNAAQVLWWEKIITLFMWFVATHDLITRKLIGSLSPSHRFVARISFLNGAEWVKSSTLQDSLLNK